MVPLLQPDGSSIDIPAFSLMAAAETIYSMESLE